MAVIQHGRDYESYYCRNCDFSDSGIKGALKQAKRHAKETGHTVDVYYETWREINYVNLNQTCTRSNYDW